ncbi:MAG: carbohydrate ABC transporter permease [Eubacteriales bacterium]
MNTKTTQAPPPASDSKHPMRVMFQGRISDKDRLRMKLTSPSFWIEKVWFFFRFVIMLGVSYVILSPFLSKILQSFMAKEDFVDATVSIIPKNWNLQMYKFLIIENEYFQAMFNTAALSLICALLQTFCCCMVGYGLAKFKFKGNKLVTVLVIITMAVPHSTLRLSMLQHFVSFDLAAIQSFNMKGPIELIFGNTIKLTNSFWPLIIMSMAGIGLKNGLYIFMMRQFFRGVPDELEESAYVDGSGTFHTFVRIILPLSIPMMITIFLFAFSWQWTDSFYSELFFAGAVNKTWLLPDIISTIPPSLETGYAGKAMYYSAIRNTGGILIILPLLIIYLFCQRYLVQGIERSGLVG